jgi:hypothetical protein
MAARELAAMRASGDAKASGGEGEDPPRRRSSSGSSAAKAATAPAHVDSVDTGATGITPSPSSSLSSTKEVDEDCLAFIAKAKEAAATDEPCSFKVEAPDSSKDEGLAARMVPAAAEPKNDDPETVSAADDKSSAGGEAGSVKAEDNSSGRDDGTSSTPVRDDSSKAADDEKLSVAEYHRRQSMRIEAAGREDLDRPTSTSVDVVGGEEDRDRATSTSVDAVEGEGLVHSPTPASGAIALLANVVTTPEPWGMEPHDMLLSPASVVGRRSGGRLSEASEDMSTWVDYEEDSGPEEGEVKGEAPRGATSSPTSAHSSTTSRGAGEAATAASTHPASTLRRAGPRSPFEITNSTSEREELAGVWAQAMRVPDVQPWAIDMKFFMSINGVSVKPYRYAIFDCSGIKHDRVVRGLPP